MGRSRGEIESMKQQMREEDAMLIEQERRQINMRINTQQTSREIDQIIRKGGDSGQILNLIADKIFNR